MRQRIAIDPDLHQVAVEYVEKQLAVLRSYNDARELTPQEYDDLVYRVAKYPQDVRNLQKKIDRKNEREARRARRAKTN